MDRWIIFDLDGVLMDTAPAIEAAANRVRERRNLGNVDSAVVREMLVNPAGRVTESDLLVPPDAGGKERRDALMLFGRYLDVVFPDNAVPYPGIERVLQDLLSAGFHLALMSNRIALFLSQWVEYAGWSGWFDPVFGEDSFPFPIPSPEAYTAACARIRATPRDAIYVSGSLAELSAADAAGLVTIQTAYGRVSPASMGSALMVTQPSDLVKLADWV